MKAITFGSKLDPNKPPYHKRISKCFLLLLLFFLFKYSKRPEFEQEPSELRLTTIKYSRSAQGLANPERGLEGSELSLMITS